MLATPPPLLRPRQQLLAGAAIRYLRYIVIALLQHLLLSRKSARRRCQKSSMPTAKETYVIYIYVTCTLHVQAQVPEGLHANRKRALYHIYTLHVRYMYRRRCQKSSMSNVKEPYII